MATKKQTSKTDEQSVIHEATMMMNGDTSLSVDDVLNLATELEAKKKAVIASLLEQQQNIITQLERLGYTSTTSTKTVAASKPTKRKSGQRPAADRECPICSKKHGALIKGHDSRSHRHHPKAFTLDEISAMND